ncbi:hypothetical protein Ro45lw_42 [Escherichia phage Ro45lw]|uniref:HNH nuclease domain-containing protein n=1 Tax=Escherichia phage Ro45lw TaxID=2498616 RepID=A0A3Q9I5C7_9CAUD|nr:endonuclease [Escherichia phage Ro45lw]AZS13030.1 hypothetical protein Ro45lw_42 [Escherichia phage Ro45lw]
MKNGTASERLARLSTVEVTGCVRFTGGLNSSGYGNLWVDGKTVGAHRVAYELANGPIPKGSVLRHTCDNRYCVNPEHLVLGTHRENMEDMTKRGRQARGSKISTCVLSEEDVRSIRSSDKSGVELAQIFGISPVTISRIKRRLTWQHVE